MPRIVIRTRLRPDQVARVVAGLGARGADATSLQTAVGTIALNLIKRAFLAKSRGGTDDAGQSWKPLAPSTLAARRKGKGKGTPEILRDTGVLFESLSMGVASAAGGSGSVAVGTNDPKAIWLHHGTPTMPARPLWPAPVDWPDGWWLKMGKAARDVLVAILRRELGGG